MAGFGALGLFVTIEDTVKGTIVEGASDPQHSVAVLLDPPGARTFHPRVADEFVRRLNGATANGIAPEAIRAVMDAVPVVVQIADELADELRRLIVSWLQALERADHVVDFSIEEAA